MTQWNKLDLQRRIKFGTEARMAGISNKNLHHITALIDKGAAFEGNLTFEGIVRIGGKFRGEIFTKDTLVVDPGADIEAQIEANVVIISGTVKGNVFAQEQCVMHPPAILKGTVTTPSLKIDEGVVFEGASYMP